MIRIGPAGWDYQDWQGVVYPPGLRGTDRLAFLAEMFGVVEINVTFYRAIAPSMAQRWLEAVAARPDFHFTAKLWQLFTHERQLLAEEMVQFQEGLLPLLQAGRLGVLLAQFPYSFHNNQENRFYLMLLKTAFPDFPLAVEVRHRSWQRREARDFFREVGLDFCNIDQPQVSYSLGATSWVTGPRAYLRCHGRHRQAWFDFQDDRQARYDYLYSQEELGDLAVRIREIMTQTSQLYLIFNNHPRGQAVANALELYHLLTGQRFRLPDCLTASFPHLSALTADHQA